MGLKIPAISTWTFQIKMILIALFVVTIVATTAKLTWAVAEGKFDKERLELSRQALIQEKASTAYWIKQVNDQQQLALENEKSKAALSEKLDQLKKDWNKNAKPLPSNCVIDADSVWYLQRARDEAIANATGKSSD